MKRSVSSLTKPSDSLMTPDQFFSGLSKLIETLQKAGHGSVYLTQKRSDHCPRPQSFVA